MANKIKSWYFKLFSQSDLYFKCLEALSWCTPQKPILNSVKHFCGYLKKCIIWLPRALSRPCLKIFPWKKFLIFFPKTIKKIKKKLLFFLKKKLFLYFGKQNFLKNLLWFQERIFRVQKIKKTHSEKISHEISTATRENPYKANTASEISRKLRESWTIRIR